MADPRPFVYTQSLAGLARLLYLLLGLQLVAWLVLTGAAYANEDGASVAADHAAGIAGLSLVVLAVATAVVWIVWFAVARRNVAEWSPAYQRHGRGWAVGAWLCPVLNLWFPYEIARDILDDTERPDGYPAPPRPPRPLLTEWWLWTVLQAPLAYVVVLPVLVTRDSGQAVEITLVAFTAVTVVPIVLALLVVRQVTTAQERRRTRAYAAVRGR